MFAAVDLGSNSFRLHIGQHDGQSMRIIKTMRDPIRLGAGLDSHGNLTDQAIQIALASLQRFAATLAEYPLQAVRVVATNILRVAGNAAAFLPAAETAIGYPIEIISGEEEGRLIYMGVASALNASNERRLVLDIGGGSTELILGKGADIEQVESFSIGTARQNSAFFANQIIDATSFEAAILSARSRFEDAAPIFSTRWTNAYGSSGTIRVIGEAIAKNGLGDGTISQRSLEALKSRLTRCGHVSKIDLAGIKADRVTMISGGLAILIGLMQELGIKVLTPVDAGLRMGVLSDLQLRATKRDRREQSVHGFLQRFGCEQARAEQVAEIASLLYAQLKPGQNSCEKPLYWSGLLHEVGMAVSHSGYHKHGAYMVDNADLPGFTRREQQAMSLLILAQKGNLRKISETLADPDFCKAILALRLAVMFMYSRIDVRLDSLRVRMKNRIELDIARTLMTDHPTLSVWLDKEKESWQEVGIDFVVRLNG